VTPPGATVGAGNSTGAGHDWRYLLGPEVLNVLGATDAIAYVVRGLSAAMFAVALWVALAPLVAPRFAAWRDASEEVRLSARRQMLSVREPRNPVKPVPAPGPECAHDEPDTR
jgi:hypothetical protein